jgi:hypothetical protein
MMEWSGLLLDVVKGGLGAAASAAPDAWKKRALARLNDANPFAATPTNHDLLRAVRLAWIEAALAVVEAAAQDAERDTKVAQVVELARNELRDARSRAFNRDVDPAFSPIDAHLDLIMNGVAEPIASSVTESRAQEVTRDFAATFCEIINWPFDELPPPFTRIAALGLAKKGDTPRDFGGLAFAEFAEILKSPTKYPEAGKAFHIATEKLARNLAEQTFAAVQGLDAKMDAALAQLDALKTLHAGIDVYLALLPGIVDGIARVEASVDALPEKIVAIFEKKEEARRAESAGLERFVILALARRITNVETVEQALIELERAVEIAIKVQEEGALGSNSGAFVDEVLRRVAALSRQGLFDEAADAADDAFAQWQSEEQERRETALQGGLKLLDSSIEQNMLRRDAKAVARLEAQKIDLEHLEAKACFDALWSVQDEYYVRGRDKGVNLDLEVAIELAQISVERASGFDHRGQGYNNLGNALSVLGEREGDPARLRKAVVAFRTALVERTRERAPLSWAMTQNNLGNTLQALGERESDPTRLRQAIEIYRGALKEYTRARAPLDWAMTQSNLGNALWKLGERENDPARLRKAVEAFREALTEYTRERAPLDWARLQNNLGNALWTLGERESDPALLGQAIEIYREALKEYIRERVPLYWAMTQNNLGNALSSLGERESDPALLRQAIEAYREVLNEYTRERVPLDWAMTQNNLGVVLRVLGARERDPALLRQAVAAYREALKEYTHKRAPYYWAQARENMAIAFLAIYRRTGEEADRAQALEAVDDSLAVYRDAQPGYYIAKAEALRAQILAAAPAP